MLAPVPPLATVTIPLTLAAFPVIFPVTLLPATVAILISVTAASAKSTVAMLPFNILAELTALEAIVGEYADPDKSPDSLNIPFVSESASSMDAETTFASTYVFTAFCVGNRVVLVPNAALDLLDASSFKASELVTADALAFKANPGTVGKSAVPAKSPANLSFPFADALASMTPPAVASWTKAVVANLVELSVEVCVLAVVPVGKDGVPVNVGEFKGAFRANELVTSDATAFSLNAVAVAELMGLSSSEVLSTLDKPIIVLVIPLTVPVKVGDSMGAFKANPGTVGEAAVPAKSPAN